MSSPTISHSYTDTLQSNSIRKSYTHPPTSQTLTPIIPNTPPHNSPTHLESPSKSQCARAEDDPRRIGLMNSALRNRSGDYRATQFPRARLEPAVARQRRGGRTAPRARERENSGKGGRIAALVAPAAAQRAPPPLPFSS